MSVPEDWPTEEMIRAGERVDPNEHAAKGAWVQAVLEAALAAAPTPSTGHWSDCSVHNEPAMPNEPCDCGADAPVQHPDDEAVDRFAIAMKEKLARARAKGRDGWDDPDRCSIEYLQDLLEEHVAKGDPVDVGNLSMMLYLRGGRTTPPAPEVEPVAWHVKRAAFKQYNNGGEFYGRDEAFFNAGFDAGYAHHPANEGLRKAAEWAVKQHQTSGGLVGLAMENLRAELNKVKS